MSSHQALSPRPSTVFAKMISATNDLGASSTHREAWIPSEPFSEPSPQSSPLSHYANIVGEGDGAHVAALLQGRL